MREEGKRETIYRKKMKKRRERSRKTKRGRERDGGKRIR